MKLSDLNPNERNPRKISEKQLEMLKKSLNEFGDLSGLVLNRRTGKLVGGHQRTKVLPPDSDIIILQKYDVPTRTGTIEEGFVLVAGDKLHFRVVDWDEQKELGALVAANKHGGSWDEDQLSELIEELDQADYDSDLLGFENEDIERLIEVAAHTRELTKEPQCGEDEIPEAPKEPITKLGDIYQLGLHRLMCGDSTSIDAVEKLMTCYVCDCGEVH